MKEAFTASEAHKMSEANRNQIVRVDHLLPIVYDLIKAAAKKGLFEVVNPLVGLRTPISDAQHEKVFDTLREQGFTVTANLNKRETTVSWK